MAAVAASAVAGQALLGPAVGVGGLTLAGGAAAMGMFNCPDGARPCRVSILDSWIYILKFMSQTMRGCRPRQRIRGRFRCPRITGK